MNKKIISIALILSMLIGMLAIMPISIGAEASDITIASVDDWMTYLSGKEVGEANITVTASELDFKGKTVEPAEDFKGTFNGNGVVIKNLTIETSGETGLFRCPSGDIEIRNLVITKSSFKGKKWVGAVICCTANAIEAKLENIFVSASVDIEATTSHAGGIVGGFGSSTTTAKVNDCVFAGEIVSPDKTGGITGLVPSVCTLTVTDSLVTGKVSPKGSSCGFVGISTGTVNLTNCIYAGDGGEEDWFNSYPLVSGGTVNVENCYTTYADESSGFEGVVYKGSDGKKVTYKGFGGSNDNDQVIYLNKSRDTLIGLNCSTTVEGFTKRDGDIMIPDGVASFASTAIFGKFTVTWKNYDGTVLDTDEVLAGETPEYKGEEIPTRPEDTQFIYTFADKWFPAITAVSGDVTYTAAFDREFTGNDAPADYYDVWYGESRYSYKTFGSGTKEDPYIIRTAEQWANLAEATADGIAEGLYFELAVNLDFNGVEGLKPISPDGKKTLIYFDGNGHTIKGVNMTWSDDGTGLFGEIWGSANLDDNKTSVIENFYITESVFNGGEYVGALIGEVSGNVIVSNIYVDSSVVVRGSGTKKDEECSVGGIIGGCYYDNKGWIPENKVVECTLEINDCVFAGRVLSSGTKNGGIVGNGNSKKESSHWEMFHIVINNSLVTGYVPNDKDRSNGFVGHNDHTCKDSDGNVYTYGDRTEFTASVTLNGCIYAGGAEDVCFYNRPFFGTVTTPTVNNCYTTHTAANGVYNNVKWISENSGVKLVEIETLMGNGATVPTGWVKRSGDLAIPAGVADFAPLTFTQELIDGAAVRLVKDDAGLRFIAVTGRDYLDFFKGEGKTVTQGIIIAPTDYITGDFTVEALGSESKYLEIEALKYVNDPEADGYYKYTGVIVDINTFNYTRDFSAIAYIKVVDDETQEATYYYSDYNEKVNSRNVADVARAALYDTKTEQVGDYQYKVLDGVYSPYTDDERTILANFCVDGDSVELEDVTFLTYNIRNIVDGKFEYDGRQNKVVSSILSYNADIIGLQEADKHSGEDWFNYLDDPTNGLPSAGYACYKGEDIKPDTFMSKDDVYNPIYYKANKFRVITELSGTYWYTEDGSCGKTQAETPEGSRVEAEHYKAFNYVVFEDIYTGARFVYINSHMEIRGSNNYLNPVQEQQAKYLDAFVDSLQTKDAYIGLPIVIGGDFNFDYNGMMGYFGDDSIIRNAAKEAKANGGKHVYGCSTISEDFTTVETSGSPIDHWYVCGDADVSGYEVLDNKTDGKYPSDHKPVRLTVTLIAKIKA